MLQPKEDHQRKANVIEWPYGSGVANHQIRPSIRTQKLLEQYHNWKLSLGYETLYWWTKIHRQTEEEPGALRRAKSLYAFAENVSLHIQPWELIVGVFERQPRCFSPTPDVDSDGTWIMNELDMLNTRFPDPILVDEKTRTYYKDLLPYWENRTMSAVWHRDMSELGPDALSLRHHGGVAAYLASYCHMHLGYDTLIQKGICGLKNEIMDLKAELYDGSPDYKEKALFYDSCLIACDAYITFAERYAKHAGKLAEEEKDAALQANYEKVAEICRNVATRPAENLHEALQTIWFAQLLAVVESGLTAFGFGRTDQYLYPYYKKDIKTGLITREKAQELLDSFWIKTAEPVLVLESISSKSVAGQPLGQQLDIGGVDENGEDATNDMSYMMLQASMNTRLIQPTVGVLWHREMPPDFAKMAIELTSLGTGHPSHFGSDTMVNMLKNVGLTEEEARQGCLIGCLEPSGKQGTTQSNCSAGPINLGLVVDLVVTNGVSRLTGEPLGVSSGDVSKFKSFADVINAFEKQMMYFQENFALQACHLRKIHKQYPLPFESLLMPNCVETGVDLVDGGALYNFSPAATLVGISDFIDAMAAIKHLIFEKKKITWQQMCHALDTNFEDMDTIPSGPEIRRMCLSAPKYGNDVDEVDELAVELMKIIPRLTAEFSIESGTPIRCGIVPVTSYVPMGMVVGALPSGRKAGEPLADGCSPKQGMDTQGPTAVIRSVTRWNHDPYTNGVQFNIKFTPSTLKDPAGLQKFTDLINVFTENGGMHVQCNVVSPETLKDAQVHPEKYPGLMVRVAGYSAYFVDLDVEIQNDIISRTDHSL